LWSKNISTAWSYKAIETFVMFENQLKMKLLKIESDLFAGNT